MKYALLFAFMLLAAIFLGSIYSDSIKSYVIQDVLNKELCELNGQQCKCYSKECVCGDRIVPKGECINRVLA